MKAHKSSLFMMTILLVMPVFNLSLNVLAAHQDETATLRGNAVVGQEERILAKGGGGGGGNGGGGQNKNNESITPAPTKASTPAPTKASTPRPTQGYQPVDPESCENAGFTRPPTTPQPAPTPPTPPTCENPAAGTCGNKNPCCDGFECSGGKDKTCVAVRRNLRVEQAKSFPFQTSVADASHRKLNTCSSDQCNEFNNEVLCGSLIPQGASGSPSFICSYGEYTDTGTGIKVSMTVDPCDPGDSDTNFCCEDGAGGYYKPRGCWGGIDEQCCPKGYTKTLTYETSACIPLNCCDAKDDIKEKFCPINC